MESLRTISMADPFLMGTLEEPHQAAVPADMVMEQLLECSYL